MSLSNSYLGCREIFLLWLGQNKWYIYLAPYLHDSRTSSNSWSYSTAVVIYHLLWNMTFDVSLAVSQLPWITDSAKSSFNSQLIIHLLYLEFPGVASHPSFGHTSRSDCFPDESQFNNRQHPTLMTTSVDARAFVSLT